MNLINLSKSIGIKKIKKGPISTDNIPYYKSQVFFFFIFFLAFFPSTLIF